jgi:hypothetical protein
MRFSQRIGQRPVKTELEREGLSDELRNTLWTITLELIIKNLSNKPRYDNNGHKKLYSELADYYRDLWILFFKHPIDNLPISFGSVDEYESSSTVRKWFFKSDWDLVLDFIEFNATYNDKFQEVANSFLKREMSAYRFVDSHLVEVNSKEEVQEIEEAIKNSNNFQSVKQHLKRSVSLYSDRKSPDYRNSIKESISAVESLAKILVKDDKTTLGQALKVIEKNHQIPRSLKSAFSALYGYTSDEGGIRHSLLEKGVKVEIEEARFMLIACSAFVNYLISKK